VVVLAGDTDADPVTPLAPKLDDTTVVAFVDDQLNVLVSPAMMEDGLADSDTVGGGRTFTVTVAVLSLPLFVSVME